MKLGLERDDRIFSELAEKSIAPDFFTVFNVFSEATFPILALGM
jgi:hypothetical protein